MTESPSERTPEERQVDALIAEIELAAEQGRPVDLEEFLKPHPQHAEEVREHFKDAGLLHKAIQAIQPEPEETAPLPGSAPRHLKAGTTVRYFGDYEILEELGSGGMGVVYKARQTKLKRMVALKMIKRGQFASEEEVGRFQAEARAAAKLDHPGIVGVIEVGLHHGEHYFAMDFVAGGSLSALYREQPVAARRAAEIVKALAEAIDFAHSKGIVHRDLKPANVLLTMKGVPRITDFGLAMRMRSDDDSTAVTMTQTGQVLGTAGYMSPEQAAGKNDEVKFPTDIYSLGAILYALLTSRAPFVGDSPSVTILQVINNEPVAVRALNPAVPRDLETICLKCLEKEPHKRYGTAQLLADDLTRFLENKPVLARPVSLVERSWRWCRRNPWAATALSLLLLLAVGSPPVAYRQYALGRDKDQLIGDKDRLIGEKVQLIAEKEGLIGDLRTAVATTKTAEQQARNDRTLAETRATEAETRRKETEKVAEFQASLLQKIDAQQLGLSLTRGIDAELARLASRPDAPLTGEQQKQLTKTLNIANMTDVARHSLGEQILAPARKVINERFTDQPRVRVQLLQTLGSAYRELGLSEAAEPILKDALDVVTQELNSDSVLRLQLLAELGLVHQEQGLFAEADELHQQALTLAHEANLESSPRFLFALHNRATALREQGKYVEAEAALRDVVERRKKLLGPQSSALATSLNSLGVLLAAKNQHSEAEQVYREALAILEAPGQDEVELTAVMHNLGSLLSKLGRLEQAAPLIEAAYSRRVKLTGEDHLYTLYSLNELATLRMLQGQIPEAIKLFDEALERSERTLGETHPRTLTARNNVANLLHQRGRAADALRLFQKNLEMERLSIGPKHPTTLTTLNNVGMTLLDLNRLPEAESCLREALDAREQTLGATHEDTLFSVANLGKALISQGKQKEAAPLLKRALQARDEKLGKLDPRSIELRKALGNAYATTGQIELAIQVYEDLVKAADANFGQDHAATLDLRNTLGALLWRSKRYDQAILTFEQIIKIYEDKQQSNNPRAVQALANLSVNYRDAGRIPEASQRASDFLVRFAQVSAIDQWGLSWFLPQAAALLEQSKQPSKAAAARKLLLETVRKWYPAESPELAGQLALLSQELLSAEKFEQAETHLREVLTIREAKEPMFWSTFNTKSMLGASLLGQKKYQAAEPLLVDGYEGLKQREQQIPPEGKVRLTQALARLVQLYEALEDAEKAGEWRMRLERAQVAEPSPAKP